MAESKNSKLAKAAKKGVYAPSTPPGGRKKQGQAKVRAASAAAAKKAGS